MNMEDGQTRLPGLLGKLGKLTAIRDTELLEQSLLKTLGPLLGVLDTSLYRTDEDLVLARVIHYHRSKEVDASGASRIVEQIEEILNMQDIPPEVLALTENVRLLGRPCTRKVGEEIAIAYPLFGDGTLCGYFVFHRDHEVSAAEDTMIRGVLEVFSNYYALLDASMRDRLTGLLNRHALENSFDRLWTVLGRPARYSERVNGRRGSPAGHYWLAVIDIDHFKQINDVHGHMVGDEMLLLASRLMCDTFRSSDLLYRYGGEEFVAIISADDEQTARSVFERVRQTIETHHFPRIEKMTISIGYCAANTDLLPQEVLGRADRSLYEAKRQGRNRVCEYEELVRTGVFREIGYGETELF
ncbi:MAG TPA: GGDEF domain-containing protein [Azospira sp.]|nr:GGDEF domain-containing protein [Azospira sp.]